MYDHVVKCQRAGLCLSEHFLIVFCFYTLSCNIVTSVLHDRLETFGTFCQETDWAYSLLPGARMGNRNTTEKLKSAQRDTNLRAGTLQPDRTF